MAKCRVNWGRTRDGSAVKLFGVFNTAHNCLYVLAPDETVAMSIAYTANHIYSPTPKFADSYSRMAHEVAAPRGSKLQSNWDKIQLAIYERLQGTVHFEDNQVTIGDEVIQLGAL